MSWGAAAGAAHSSSAGEVAALYHLFGVGDVAAHYIILVDTSLSMSGDFNQVKTALRSLAKSLKSGDQVSLITFDNQAKLVYRGTISKSKVKFIKELPRRPNPSGRKTDIGAALNLAVSRIKDSRSPLQFVFFLTDGREEPPGDSPFKKDHDAAWERLAEAAGKIRGKSVKAHGIGLNSATDINLLQKIFPHAALISVGPAQLQNYFVGLKSELRRERLKIKLQDELDRGRVNVHTDREWGAVKSGGQLIRRLEFISTYRRLPVEVTLNGAHMSVKKAGRPIGGFTLRFKGKSRFELRPGEKKAAIVVLQAPKLPHHYYLGRKTSVYQGDITLKLDRGFTYRRALAAVGMPAAPAVGSRRQVVFFSHRQGLAWPTVAALAAALLLAAAFIIRFLLLPAGRAVSRRWRSPALTGRLTFSRAPAGRSLPPPVNLAAAGSRAVIGTNGNVKLSGDEVTARHAELTSKWVAGRPQVYLRRLEGTVRVADSPTAAGRDVFDEIELKKGNIIEIGGYRMQWL